MTIRARRIFTYLALAAVCYGIAVVASVEAAFVAFAVAGGFCEILFWKELFWPARR